MADLTDVEETIAGIVSAAIYPNGTGQPSAMPGGTTVSISRGWPLPACLDADLAAGQAQITIYPLSNSSMRTYQILDHTYVITPAVIDLTVTIDGNGVITAEGQPATGEYLTLVIDDAVVCSQSGANTQTLLAALAAQAITFGYAATSTATTITVPFGHSMVVRQGGVAVMGKVLWRQIHSIMVCVWAPSDAIRTAAAKLADVALKENLKLTMPDTSQCILRYSRTMSTDQQEKAMIYRRDLIFDAEYATVEEFPGYVITSTQISIATPNNTAIANAITGGETEAGPTIIVSGSLDFSSPTNSQYLPLT